MMLLSLSSLLFFATILPVSLAVPVHTHAVYPHRIEARNSVINAVITMMELIYQAQQFRFGVTDKVTNDATALESPQDSFGWDDDEEEDRSSLWKRLREMFRRHRHRFIHHLSHRVVHHLRQRIRDHVARHRKHFMRHIQKHLKAHYEKISKILANGGGDQKAMKSKSTTTSSSPVAPAAPNIQSPAPPVPKKKPGAIGSVKQKNKLGIDGYVQFSSKNTDDDLEDTDIQNEN